MNKLFAVFIRLDEPRLLGDMKLDFVVAKENTSIINCIILKYIKI